MQTSCTATDGDEYCSMVERHVVFGAACIGLADFGIHFARRCDCCVLDWDEVLRSHLHIGCENRPCW